MKRGLLRRMRLPPEDVAEEPELHQHEAGDDRGERPRQEPQDLHSPNSLSPGAKVQVRVITIML